MPIRMYRCERCHITEEVIEGRKFVGMLCPECNKAMQRMVTAGNFHLKGSGWYATDYKNPSSSSKNGKE